MIFCVLSLCHVHLLLPLLLYVFLWYLWLGLWPLYVLSPGLQGACVPLTFVDVLPDHTLHTLPTYNVVILTVYNEIFSLLYMWPIFLSGRGITSLFSLSFYPFAPFKGFYVDIFLSFCLRPEDVKVVQIVRTLLIYVQSNVNRTGWICSDLVCVTSDL